MQGRCHENPATPGPASKQLMGRTDAAGAKNAATLQGY